MIHLQPTVNGRSRPEMQIDYICTEQISNCYRKSLYILISSIQSYSDETIQDIIRKIDGGQDQKVESRTPMTFSGHLNKHGHLVTMRYCVYRVWSYKDSGD
jgi:hypothetical protein